MGRGIVRCQGALIMLTVMLRRVCCPSVKLSRVLENTRWGVASHLLPGTLPFTVKFMRIVSPGAGGSDRLRAVHTP